MSKHNIGDIEIDMDTGLLEAQVGDDHIVVDVLRDEKVLDLVQRLVEAIRDKPNTGGADNCDHCVGTCCTGWSMSVTEQDVQRLAAGLKMPIKQLRKKYIDGYNTIEPALQQQLRHVKDTRFAKGSRCRFLAVTKDKASGAYVGRCSVYLHRPEVCRDFPAHDCNEFVPISRLFRRGPVVDKR